MYAKCILLLLSCLVLASSLKATIRNGYSQDLSSARECLKQLDQRLLITADNAHAERRRITAAIKKHAATIALYELTRSLLEEFQAISPGMYAQLDELKDKRGRKTDVYVRFIPEQDASVLLSGASFFQISSIDEDASQSRYGNLSVAIDVWICDTSLHLLAHEFGHTRYIVPNLAGYRKFYMETYRRSQITSHVGHNASDASGRMAYTFGHEFLRDRRWYKASHGEIRHVSAIAREVKSRVHESVEVRFDEYIASLHSHK